MIIGMPIIILCFQIQVISVEGKIKFQKFARHTTDHFHNTCLKQYKIMMDYNEIFISH